MSPDAAGRFAGAARPPMVLCIGRNYGAHAAEMGADRPERPMVFAKNSASVIGDGAEIVIPAICREHGPQVDFEGELAVIIGPRDVRDVPREHALAAVAGYAAANDVSARWWQKHGAGGQFVRGKSFDTFCPIGTIVPASEVSDPAALELRTVVSGEEMQHGMVSDMIFPVDELVAELSRGMTLLAGTVILTGSPAGVGHARTPPRYLSDGDTVTVTLELDGSVRSSVRNPVREDGPAG